MIAFADPVFSKMARKEAQKVALRSMTNFYSGTQIDIQALAESLPQLPSTRAEVLNIAKTLNVPASDIHLGLEATVTAVKKAPLDQYRIIYFATHALVTGDLKAFAQAPLTTSQCGSMFSKLNSTIAIPRNNPPEKKTIENPAYLIALR
jgi:hypothetical protein